jgi:hypothetical protein
VKVFCLYLHRTPTFLQEQYLESADGVVSLGKVAIS